MHALLMREIITRFGRENLGVLWLVGRADAVHAWRHDVVDTRRACIMARRFQSLRSRLPATPQCCCGAIARPAQVGAIAKINRSYSIATSESSMFS